MTRVYKIKFFPSSPMISGVLALILFFGVATIVFVKHASIWVAVFFLIICSFVAYLGFFYFARLEIHVDEDFLIFKMPDKITQFKIKDIYKIEKYFSYSGRGYFIFFRDANGNKRHIIFNNDLLGHEELIQYLQSKSGIKMRWEGTVDVENEKRPLIRILKIVWNILITLFIVGACVVYPFLASSNRDKERRMQLPERALWP